MSLLNRLYDLGQAVWIDYIRRSFLIRGGLQELIDQGVRGVTSNPTIFEKAIAGSADYDADLTQLARAGKSTEEIYEALVIDDIRLAADQLRPVYDATKGVDGYVSLEVSPTLARDSEGTVLEGQRLFKLLDRPNVMIKVPATMEGIPAIRRLIGQGINVNVTLIFSVRHYETVVEAYLAGLEDLAAGGGDPSQIASVASFFISRLDGTVDPLVEGTQLPGTIAIANARVAYERYQQFFSGSRWIALSERGARVQRVLWASTGTKNPLYSDTLYIDQLIGPDTVNTVPPATLNAFLDHGRPAVTITEGLSEAHMQLKELADRDIDLDRITEELQEKGVDSFAASFTSLMGSIEQKRISLSDGWQPLTEQLGPYRQQVDTAIAGLVSGQIVGRIWAHDHTVWRPEPSEINNRLGWLHIAEAMKEQVPRLTAFSQSIRETGYTQALLLGMGGSSLAPEVMASLYGVPKGYLDVSVLDSTDPAAVEYWAEHLDLSKTLFIVSTKSGGTVETLSFFKFFYNKVQEKVGEEQTGQHFVAITDPGSSLAELAATYHFRSVFINDPNIGGRYSALSFFGLVPAALLGVDLEKLLDRALTMSCNAEPANCPEAGDNLGARLGAALGTLALAGRDKLSFICSPKLASFADWAEQLIAESTGKEGKGILPVAGEEPGAPDVYGSDRVFVYLRLIGEESWDQGVSLLEQAGHPVLRLNWRDPYDLGAQFFLWEMATAVTGHILGINPFDQPDVESAKIRARDAVARYQQEGSLAADSFVPATAEELRGFLSKAEAGAYVAVQAYLQPTPQNAKILKTLQNKIRQLTGLAVTVGFGPRFLHSTGQLHKGDAGRGYFVQITAEDVIDQAIPDQAGSEDSSISFGVLKTAQALGDKQALEEKDRAVVRLHIEGNVNRCLETLVGAL